VERSDDEELRRHADRLADVLEAVIPGWVERAVAGVAEAWQPGAAARLAPDAARAGREAVADVGPRLRALLSADVDQQGTGPLDVCRSAVRHPTRVLAAAGVPPVRRDDFSVRAFPDDVYDLSPASFAAIAPEAGEPGIVWGAAKAHVVLARRRAEGLR
jgi:hypothetical protein